MAAQVNNQARIAEVRGVQQRLTARKSVNPNSDEERTANGRARRRYCQIR